MPSLAAAACGGQDLLAAMATDDPDRHAAIIAAADGVENGEARFWQVTGPDGGVSHLFGTYHDTASSETISAPVRTAFAGAERLVMEMSDEELARMEQRIATDPSFSFREVPVSATMLMDGIDENERAIVEQALAARGLTLPVAGRLQPWLLFSLFGVPACQLAEMAGGAEVMDRELAAEAAEAGKPVLGLEGYEEALSTFTRIPEDDAVLMIRDYLALVPLEEDMRATLLAQYGAGRIGVIQAFTEDLGAAYAPGDPAAVKARNDMLMQGLLNDRNLAWMDRLLPYLQGGGAFVAVGALHLPGEVGLVTLLRDAGYRVEPLGEDG
ncbi:MAG: TraB/GumN family protein [Pseudomonadota bacterium]